MPDFHLECGDCVKLMQEVPAGSINLAICDPPYSFGQPYDAYADNLGYDEYVRWTEKWLTAAVRILHKHGSLWVFSPDDWVSEIDVMARTRLKLYKRRHVIWAFTFGQAAQNNFSRSHAHLLYFTKAKTKFTFNADALRVPSARQLVYKDTRQNPKGKLPDATWMLLRDQLEPYMAPDKDTWMESRVCGTFKERKSHCPNQIPIPIMERIVKACSNLGDAVLDPFGGTFSSGVASLRHRRRYIGFDLSKNYVKAGVARLEGFSRE